MSQGPTSPQSKKRALRVGAGSALPRLAQIIDSLCGHVFCSAPQERAAKLIWGAHQNWYSRVTTASTTATSAGGLSILDGGRGKVVAAGGRNYRRCHRPNAAVSRPNNFGMLLKQPWVASLSLLGRRAGVRLLCGFRVPFLGQNSCNLRSLPQSAQQEKACLGLESGRSLYVIT